MKGAFHANCLFSAQRPAGRLRATGAFKFAGLEHFNISCLRTVWYCEGMKPTSIDLRQRILAARITDRQSMGQIASRFKIPKGTVQNILERYRDSGSVEPKPQNAGRKPAFWGSALRRLERDVLLHPDSTLAELRDRSGVKVSVVTVHYALRRLDFTLKKSLYARASNVAPTSLSDAKPGANRLKQ